MSFTQIGLLDFSGVLQSWLREVWGSSAWFPPIRSRGGVVLVMSLALYPYVYLLARDAFASQGRRALEAALMEGDLAQAREIARRYAAFDPRDQKGAT